MADVKIPIPSQKYRDAGMEDDFNYGSNVAQAHKNIRLGFLRKVYGLLSAQLILTVAVASVIIMVEDVHVYLKQSPGILMFSMFGSFASLIGLMFMRASVPANYILLGIFTLFESIMVGVFASQYEKTEVLEAFVLTASVTIALTLYTLQSRYDYSSWGAGLFTALWIMIIAGILQIFIQSQLADLFLCIAGAILFSLFIVFDTYLIMAKHSPEEYIIAVVDLYLDILNLFIYILRIVGKSNDS